MRRALHALARDTRGATLVEFGLILLPLCLLLLGAFDLGYQVYLRTVMQGTLNDVARAASVEDPDFGGTGTTVEERIEAAIETRLNALARNASYDIEQRSYFEFSGVGRPEKLLTDKNSNGRYDTGDCFEDANRNGSYDQDGGQTGRGGAEDVVFYDVTVTMPRIVPVGELIGASSNLQITVSTAVRNQPYTDRAIPPTVCG